MEWYSLFDYSLPDERSWDGVKILFGVCKGRYTDLVSSRFFVIANTCPELDSVTPNKYCPRAWDRQGAPDYYVKIWINRSYGPAEIIKPNK